MGRSSTSATLRVFVALDLPLIVREELAAWLRQARLGRNLRPIKPENMHLTLAFLGEQSESRVSLATSLLSEFADREAPPLAVGAPVQLPPRRPRAFAVEVRPLDSGLARLQRDVAAALEPALGLHERRTFRPHVTVARLRRDFHPGDPPPPTPALEFEAEALTLYRSHLLSEGAEYEPLSTWPFD